ncbi:protein kinase [Solihabitans fulvus]|uniref:non-specific serine/threonine protein kinase n=1 Tax=Solihabitans fulvus TaxID=1892852 RepID=A0A5B2WMA1_9PSEU|nr:serine/threonine-protein kinase [Solihabitans fulvus]KAA2252104.1 protein kinase [Solihabitans fulvus]
MQLAEWLLSWLHGTFGANLCPGDWAWTTTAAGAIIGLLPTLGALAALVVRRINGNTYGVVAGLLFAVFGLGSTFALPLVLFTGVADALRSGALNPRASPLSGLGSMQSKPCFFVSQGDYLAISPNFGRVVTGSSERGLYLTLGVITAVLALLCLLFVMMQAGSAFRLGARWPRWLYWPPFAVFLLLTFQLPVTVVGHLLLGFFPVTALGSLVVRLFGLSTAALNRSSSREKERPEAGAGAGGGSAAEAHREVGQGQAQSQALAQQQQAQQQQLPPYRPPVQQPPPAYQRPQYPPTRVAGLPPVPPPTRAAPPSKLADTPGPLPFGLAGAAMPSGQHGPGPGAGNGPTAIWNQAGGRFRRLRQLGRGGFGTVWLAMDTQLDRTVAVKLAHAPDADTEQRMLREARALAKVHHPNCVRVYDIVEEADGLALVMEYVEGRPLSDVVRDSGVLADTFAARLWATMADALTAAHEQGVLHRDVKPSNVIVDGAGSAHLIDFGIARAKGDSTLTAAGMMMGTPDFLSPETARGESANPASDAWQLAATVSYALSGRPPRGERDNPMSALMAAAQGQPNTELPRRSAHHRLLLAALDPDPARRPTLAMVRADLGNWLAHAGVTTEGPVTTIMARPEPPTKRVEPSTKRVEPPTKPAM